MPHDFSHSVITNSGAALLMKAQTGECEIEITSMVTGSGIYTAEEKNIDYLKQLTELKSEKQRITPSSKRIIAEKTVEIGALIANYYPLTDEKLTEGYYLNEIGICAKEKDGDEATEVLYSVSVISSDQGDFMPPYNGYSPQEIEQRYFITVDNSANITIQVNSSTVVTAEDLENVISDFNVKIDKMIPKEEKGNPGGVAMLGEDGKVPKTQIPISEVIQISDFDTFDPVVLNLQRGESINVFAESSAIGAPWANSAAGTITFSDADYYHLRLIRTGEKYESNFSKERFYRSGKGWSSWATIATKSDLQVIEAEHFMTVDTAANASCWLKLCTANLTTKTQVALETLFLYRGLSPGSEKGIYEDGITIRVKQVENMGEQPLVEINHFGSNPYLKSENIVAVITENTVSKTTVELYVNPKRFWTNFYIRRILYKNFEVHDRFPLMLNLPNGVQVIANNFLPVLNENVVNNLDTETEGFVLGASQGVIIKKMLEGKMNVDDEYYTLAKTPDYPKEEKPWPFKIATLTVNKNNPVASVSLLIANEYNLGLTGNKWEKAFEKVTLKIIQKDERNEKAPEVVLNLEQDKNINYKGLDPSYFIVRVKSINDDEAEILFYLDIYGVNGFEYFTAINVRRLIQYGTVMLHTHEENSEIAPLVGTEYQGTITYHYDKYLTEDHITGDIDNKDPDAVPSMSLIRELKAAIDDLSTKIN